MVEVFDRQLSNKIDLATDLFIAKHIYWQLAKHPDIPIETIFLETYDKFVKEHNLTLSFGQSVYRAIKDTIEHTPINNESDREELELLNRLSLILLANVYPN